MNATPHAIRTGLQRGWNEFLLSLKSPQDQGFYLFMAIGILTYLWFNRDNEMEGIGLPYTTVAMPSILGALIVFGLVIGPAYSLAMEREDGTLLRLKAAPHGMAGYVSGQIVNQSLQILPTFAIILIPSMLLFDDLMFRGMAGWLTVIWVTVLGLLATLPIGMVIGSLVPGVQKVGTWGMLPVLALGGISGIFAPLQTLWDWLQVVAQVFPMYWLGLGMRSAFLPDVAATIEIGGTWRTTETILVLSAWAVVGLLVAPIVLKRMARRQSGSQVEAARHEALQYIR